MTLADFTGPGLMIPRLRGAETASAIKELTDALHAEHRVTDALPLYQAALNREFLAGTNLEPGMAFLHARLPGLKDISFALGRSVEPLRWGPHDTCETRLVFLLAVPATDAVQYLLVISGLARLAQDAGLMAGLLEARDAQQMLEVLRWVSLSGDGPRAGIQLLHQGKTRPSEPGVSSALP